MAKNTPPTPPTPVVKPTITGLERTGTGITIVSVLAALAIPGFSAMSGKLESSGQINSVVTSIVLLTIVAGVLALLGTVLNVPGLLKQPRIGRVTSTVFSGATLVVLAIFFFATVLPRVNNLNHLNSVVEPFGTSVQKNCSDLLQNETNRYKQIEADAKAFPSAINPATISVDLANYVTPINKDIKDFQNDATLLQTSATKVQALTLPDGKYGKFRDGCVTDMQGTIAFINDTTLIPTTQFLQQVIAGVTAAPASQIPTAAKPAVIAIIQANIPASYSAVSLMQASVGYASVFSPAPLTNPGIPAATFNAVSILVYGTLWHSFPLFIAGAMDTAANAPDPENLANLGTCLQNDISKTLKDNLAPLSVNTDKIVGVPAGTCGK